MSFTKNTSLNFLLTLLAAVIFGGALGLLSTAGAVGVGLLKPAADNLYESKGTYTKLYNKMGNSTTPSAVTTRGTAYTGHGGVAGMTVGNGGTFSSENGAGVSGSSTDGYGGSFDASVDGYGIQGQHGGNLSGTYSINGKYFRPWGSGSFFNLSALKYYGDGSSLTGITARPDSYLNISGLAAGALPKSGGTMTGAIKGGANGNKFGSMTTANLVADYFKGTPLSAKCRYNTYYNISSAVWRKLPLNESGASHWDAWLSFTNQSTVNRTDDYIKIRTAGTYRISFFARFAANATGIRQLSVYYNGADYFAAPAAFANSASYVTNLMGSYTLTMNVGDLLTLWAYQDSGGVLGVGYGNMVIEYMGTP